MILDGSGWALVDCDMKKNFNNEMIHVGEERYADHRAGIRTSLHRGQSGN
jgi:hypothetical protein